MSYLPLTVTIKPTTQEEWTMALRHARVGTVVSDRDGDIWRKRYTHIEGGNSWKRDNGGWATAAEVAVYAPLFEYKGD